MKIGILDCKEDCFPKDLLEKLVSRGHKAELLALRQQLLPIKKDFDVILDRAGAFYEFLQESMKAMSMCGTYIINNPFAYGMANKVMEEIICSELKIATPKTFLLPQIDKEWETNDPISWPDWNEIEKEISFPAIMKAFNGFGWQKVFEIKSIEEAKQKFSEIKSEEPMLLQEKIEFVDYYRVFCINKKETLIAKWKPAPAGFGELLFLEPIQSDSLRKKIEKQTIELNRRLDFDINAVEWCIDKNGKAIVIDAINEVPDLRKEKMPEQHYWWVVDRTAECIESKRGKKNKAFF